MLHHLYDEEVLEVQHACQTFLANMSTSSLQLMTRHVSGQLIAKTASLRQTAELSLLCPHRRAEQGGSPLSW